MGRLNAALSTAIVALLVFAMWWLPRRLEAEAVKAAGKIEAAAAVNATLTVKQYVNRGGVTTERYPGEALESWYARHLEAELRFSR